MQEVKEKRGLSGSTLKIIAMLAMLIDHIGVLILMPLIQSQGMESNPIETWYTICRFIGRIAFPIFCFLLVEGFFYTSSRTKYIIRLSVFAIISEIPFNLAVSRRITDMEHQNVFFTLLIGFIMMFAMQEFREKMIPRLEKYRNTVAFIVQMSIITGGCFLADWIRCDYGMMGIIAMMGIYILRFNKKYMCICEAIFFAASRSVQMIAALAFIPIWCYNGKRGWKMKYFFYVFYPGHLLALYGIYMLWIAK